MKVNIDLPINLKISLTLSMKKQIESFLDKHDGCISIYQTEDDLLDSLFFYWFYNSSIKKYKWLQQKNIYDFLNRNAPLLKKQLKILLNEIKNFK